MRLKTAVPMLLLLLLCACGAGETSAQRAVSFRTELKEAEGCSFQAAITADYGEYIREFTLFCSCTPEECGITVVEPETASGITAVVSGQQAQVSFEDTVLAVEQFSTRKLSPLSAPYLLMKAWTEGYVSTGTVQDTRETGEYLLGYGSEELTITTVWNNAVPDYAEISDGASTLLTCQISDFSLN